MVGVYTLVTILSGCLFQVVIIYKEHWLFKRHRWNHIVWERTGTGTNNCKLYINGAQVGQYTMNNNLSGDEIVIGGNTGGNQGTTYYYVKMVLYQT